MKNRIFVSLITIIFGILFILIPTAIFPVCDSSEMRMACFYSKQTLIGLGGITIILSVVNILSKNSGVRAGISIAHTLISILAILYPAKLIGICKMETMQCKLKTFPAIIVIATLLIIVSIINAAYLILKDKKDDQDIRTHKKTDSVKS